jgi:hypothetical protein
VQREENALCDLFPVDASFRLGIIGFVARSWIDRGVLHIDVHLFLGRRSERRERRETGREASGEQGGR